MIFSVTERGNWKRCLRQWRFSSKNGMHLGPIVAPVYLSVGTLIHNGSQAWMLDREGRMNFEQHVLVASIKMVEKAGARYKAQVGVGMTEAETDLLEESIHFARTMSRNYEIRWGSALPEGYKLIRPEQRAIIPVPGTEHPCENPHAHFDNQTAVHRLHHPDGTLDSKAPVCPTCLGTGIEFHQLDMRFDGLLVDDRDFLHVLEHKTYKNRPSDLSLKANDQFLAYVWGAEQLGVGEVVGISYDGLWRRDAVPKGKTFNDLFMRLTIPQQRARIDEFARLLPIELNRMAADTPVPFDELPFNRKWEGCYDCKAFEEACWAYSRGESDVYQTLLRTNLTTRSDDVDEDDAEEASAA
jgi:hypothetical protein